MRVVLVDDDEEMRDALRTLLLERADIDVVGEAADGRAAVERVLELHPALVLMDVAMPGMGGIEATRLVLEALPSVQVIGLSLHDDRHFVEAMRAAGASGYLLKDRVHEQLAQAMRVVAAGGTCWPSGLQASNQRAAAGGASAFGHADPSQTFCNGSECPCNRFAEGAQWGPVRLIGFLQRHFIATAVECGLHSCVSPVGILRTDPAGRCLYVNARWSEMAGRPTAEALGGGWLKALHPDDRDRVVEELYWATREDCCFESKLRFQRPDGAVSWALGQALPERDTNGKITGYTGAVTDLTRYIQTENELRASKTKLGLRNEQLRRLALRLGLTQERERRRIAAGLHDEVGQLLAVARVKLGKLVGKLMPTGAHGEVAGDAREIGALVDRTIAQTRSLTFELSSPVLHELGLGPAVESLCEQLDKESGVRFSVEVETEPGLLSEELRILLYQAVRELCGNVVKHARAPRAEVRVHADRDRIRIVVADEGEGFKSATCADNFDQEGGFGLFAIREMSSQMGGSFEIKSTPGKGTSAVLSVPIG